MAPNIFAFEASKTPSLSSFLTLSLDEGHEGMCIADRKNFA